MSKAIASAKPARRASSPAPTTPPAGPETSSRAGCVAASSAGRTPPDESIAQRDLAAPHRRPLRRDRAGSGR